MADEYVSDREQEEALRVWWRDNWRWIISGIVLGLALLGGWRYWQTWRDQRNDQAAALYAQFKTAIDKPDAAQAQTALNDLTATHASSAYVQQARLMMAKTHADAGKFDDAIAVLAAVAAEAKDKELAAIAQLRRARLLIQQDKHDEALQLLDVTSAGALAAQVREVRGDALVAKGDTDAARAEYAAALAASTNAQNDRSILELKLQDVGGTAPAPSLPGQP